MQIYACISQNEEVRLQSSSGGFFGVIAAYTLKNNGVVYGVGMSDDCYSAEYMRITESKELPKLYGSKYLQAKMNNAYSKVKNDLLSGRLVLFTGTGCLINGLRGYLQKNYENLICVDVICHGVPSPELWKRYVKHNEKKHGKLISVNFRCKNKGWKDFSLKCNSITVSKNTDPYMLMFLRNYALRPSCYECTAKDNKTADLTMADFWGIENVDKNFNDGKGTSLVLIRSSKGKDLFDKVKTELRIREVSYEEAVRLNPAEYRSVARPEKRNYFFEDMNSLSFDKLEIKYASPVHRPLLSRIKKRLIIILKTMTKLFGGGGQNNLDYSVRYVYDSKKRN